MSWLDGPKYRVLTEVKFVVPIGVSLASFMTVSSKAALVPEPACRMQSVVGEVASMLFVPIAPVLYPNARQSVT